jgi:hypothetical protein
MVRLKMISELSARCPVPVVTAWRQLMQSGVLISLRRLFALLEIKMRNRDLTSIAAHS